MKNSMSAFQIINIAAFTKGAWKFFYGDKQKFLTLHIKTMTKGNWSGFSKV